MFLTLAYLANLSIKLVWCYQDAQPRTVMPLWKANLEEPKAKQSDTSVMIVDNSTSNFPSTFICCWYATSSFVDVDVDWILFWWIVPSRRMKKRRVCASHGRRRPQVVRRKSTLFSCWQLSLVCIRIFWPPCFNLPRKYLNWCLCFICSCIINLFFQWSRNM